MGRGETVTAEQRQALTIAAREGYLDILRTGSLESVGQELDITQQAASERVRRGVRNLLFDDLNIPTE